MEQDDEIYMNGVGVMQRTRELNDKLWDAVLGAIFGTSIPCATIICTAATYFAPSSFDGGLLPWVLGANLIIAAVGYKMASPWFVISHQLRQHTAKMNAETAKRGRGWAKS